MAKHSDIVDVYGKKYAKILNQLWCINSAQYVWWDKRLLSPGYRNIQTTWLPRHAQAQNQPCSSFGIHPRLPYIKELYDDNQATFFGMGWWEWDVPPWDVVIHSSIRWMLMLLRWPLWMMWDPWWSRWLLIWLVTVAEWLQDGPEGPGGMSIICLKHHGKRWHV